MYITKAHGNGGKQTHELIQNIFMAAFCSKLIENQDDAVTLNLNSTTIGHSIDGFVVKPYCFNGGNIGKLAICGTVNDLAVSGFCPQYISVSYMIEEGFSIAELTTIAQSMGTTAHQANVQIVAGDTKVVEKGSLDQIFITTAGIGTPFSPNNMPHIDKITPGNAIIVSGDIGRHGACIYSHNKDIGFASTIESDCALLNTEIENLFKQGNSISFMRDLTRGGLATALNEISRSAKFDIEIDEEHVPIAPEVIGICDILGLDPHYLACEGRFITIVPVEESQAVLDLLQHYNPQAKIIGRILPSDRNRVLLKTTYGGSRIMDMLSYEMLPRIC